MKVLTYNVHSCAGVDGKRSIKRIAEVIAKVEPDIVALQELDAQRPRSQHHRQAELIAEALGMKYHFHPAFEVKEEQYGDALLSPHPLKMIKATSLPAAWSPVWNEQRGAVLATVQCEGREWYIINTHLGLGARERQIQAQALLGEEWLGQVPAGAPFILCGDFNSMAFGRVHTMLRKRLTDAQLANGRPRPEATFPGRRPVICLDYVFVNDAVKVESTFVQKGVVERIASDHLPLVAELRAVGDAGLM